MTLVELHLDVARIGDALEKIALLLEKLAFEPPPREDVKVHQATLDDLHTTSEEDVQRMQAEQMDFAERYRVLPGSPAMMQALVDWEDQQRSIHGENWQAPDDWRSILAAIERDPLLQSAGKTSGPAHPRHRPKEASETSAG